MREDAGSALQEHRFEFSGGALCLDFTNTLPDRPRCTGERLTSYDDLLRWGEEAGVVDRPQGRRLQALAGRRSRQAAAVLERALKLRESLFRLFAALGERGRPPAEDLEGLNRALRETLPRLQVSSGADGLGWSWAGSGQELDLMLWPVVRSAADLLTSSEVDRVRQCASENCSWLFIDRSPTRRRRWCDMKTCGNRAKARRYYRRKRRSRKSKDSS